MSYLLLIALIYITIFFSFKPKHLSLNQHLGRTKLCFFLGILIFCISFLYFKYIGFSFFNISIFVSSMLYTWLFSFLERKIGTKEFILISLISILMGLVPFISGMTGLHSIIIILPPAILVAYLIEENYLIFKDLLFILLLITFSIFVYSYISNNVPYEEHIGQLFAILGTVIYISLLSEKDAKVIN